MTPTYIDLGIFDCGDTVSATTPDGYQGGANPEASPQSRWYMYIEEGATVDFRFDYTYIPATGPGIFQFFALPGPGNSGFAIVNDGPNALADGPHTGASSIAWSFTNTECSANFEFTLSAFFSPYSWTLTSICTDLQNQGSHTSTPWAGSGARRPNRPCCPLPSVAVEGGPRSPSSIRSSTLDFRMAPNKLFNLDTNVVTTSAYGHYGLEGGIQTSDGSFYWLQSCLGGGGGGRQGNSNLSLRWKPPGGSNTNYTPILLEELIAPDDVIDTRWVPASLDWSPIEDVIYVVVNINSWPADFITSTELRRVTLGGSSSTIWSGEGVLGQGAGPVTVASDGAVWWRHDNAFYRYPIGGPVTLVLPSAPTFGPIVPTPWGDVLIWLTNEGVLSPYVVDAAGNTTLYGCPELNMPLIPSNFSTLWGSVLRTENFARTWLFGQTFFDLFFREINWKFCGSGWQVRSS